MNRQPKFRSKAFLTPVLPLMIVACASLSPVADPEELARTWQNARFWIPGDHEWVYRLMSDPRSHPPAGMRFPTVLYMHGCAGMVGADLERWASTLARAGYAMIAPNSFARQYRPTTCDPATHRARYAPDVYDMRGAEIEYAAAQIRTLSWVDQDNIFVLGFSEGGIAVAAYRGRSFKGHIITGWTCHQGYHTDLDGLWAPTDKPVLAVVYAEDPWFRNPWQRGHCGAKFGRRSGSKSIVFPGSGHSTAHEPVARQEALEFLRQHTSK